MGTTAVSQARARLLRVIETIEAIHGIPSPRMRKARDLTFGGQLHAALWEAHIERSAAQERRFGPLCAAVMEDLAQEILRKWTERKEAKADADDIPSPFDRAKWLRVFRQRLRGLIRSIIADAGKVALREVGSDISFDLEDPDAVAFMRQREQRFAVEVTQTTWEMVREKIAQGIQAGESVDQIAERIKAVMELRINQSATTIARTEVNGAVNGGTLVGYTQAGYVKGKTWLSSLDEKVRDSHQEAHGQTVGISQNFKVGEGRGPTPGQIGRPEEDINCRCTMTAVIDV